MTIKKVLILLIILLIVTTVFIGWRLLMSGGSGEEEPPKRQASSFPEVVKIGTAGVKNELLGISFWVPKNFREITGAELKAKNPLFLYGFAPPDVVGVECFVSQTKNSVEGEVTLAYLREGLRNQFKRAYGDYSEEGTEIADLGVYKGVKITIKYASGENNFKLVEVASATNKKATFVHCSAPYSLYDTYKDQFEALFSSLRIS